MPITKHMASGTVLLRKGKVYLPPQKVLCSTNGGRGIRLRRTTCPYYVSTVNQKPTKRCVTKFIPKLDSTVPKNNATMILALPISFARRLPSSMGSQDIGKAIIIV